MFIEPCTDLNAEARTKTETPINRSCEARSASLFADFSTATDNHPVSSMYFMHCRSNMARLERTLADEEEAMLADEQVHRSMSGERG